MNLIVASLMSIALAAPPSSGPTASSGPAPSAAKAMADDAHQVEVAIDVSKLEVLGDEVTKRLRNQVDQRCAAAGFGVDDGARARVEIVVWPMGRERRGYEWSIVARVDGKKVDGIPGAGLCDACLPKELATEVGAQLPEQLSRIASVLDDDAPAPATLSETDPAHGAGGPVTAPDDGPRAHGKPLGGLGIGGAVLVGVGVGAGVAGIVVATRSAKVRRDGGDVEFEEARRPRSLGIALAVVGAASLTAGIAMLVVDRRKAKSRRAAVVPAPSIGAHGAGLTIAGRF